MDEPAPLRFMPLAGQNPKGRTKNLDTSARKKQEGYTKREKRGRGSRFQPAIRNSRVGRGGIKSDKRREQEGKQNYSGAVAFLPFVGNFAPANAVLVYQLLEYRLTPIRFQDITASLNFLSLCRSAPSALHLPLHDAPPPCIANSAARTSPKIPLLGRLLCEQSRL